MKTLRRVIPIVMVIALLAAFAAPAAAQGTGGSRTLTITESQINASSWVTNPPRRTVSNVSVDLQPNQAVIYATLTYQNTQPKNTVTTLVPSVSNGRIYWTATSVLVNGQPASADVLAQVNAQIAASWTYFIKQKAGAGRVAAIQVTADALIITYAKK